MSSNLILISGPAGVGKTTICDSLINEFHPDIQRVITVTTRVCRANENNGVDYIFITVDEFKERVEQNEFLEYEEIHGNLYGTPKSSLCLGNDSIYHLINIDVNGARTIQKKVSEYDDIEVNLLSIFIKPSSLEDLRVRMNARGTERQDEIDRRLQTAISEIAQISHFDLVIDSKTKDEDYREVKKEFLKFRSNLF